jgi:hypothetical protein
MIFKDKLFEATNLISPEFDKLLELGLKKQNHFGDLLLIHVNGFFEENFVEWNKNLARKLNPHVVGPNHEGHSENTHFSFIHKYRTTNIYESSLSDYQKRIEYSPERSKEIDELIEIEEISIQLEMLIYLKFWEADMIIKKFYQLARIINGEPYDWYFKIPKNHLGKRQEIIRLKIRDRLKEVSPIIFEKIKETYKTQIRNSIAHSNYSFIGRNIDLNNYIENDPKCQLETITFDEWIDIFHSTLILHNEYYRINRRINEHYGEIAKRHNNVVQILVTEKDGKQYELPLEFRPGFNDWGYKQS